MGLTFAPTPYPLSEGLTRPFHEWLRRRGPFGEADLNSALPVQARSTPVLGFLACAAMVHRTAFLAAGGFEHRFIIGGEEDLLALDLAAAGWNLAYVPDVVVHHFPSDRRDAVDRRHLVVRDALWVAWLRFPPMLALRRTGATLGSAITDATTRR